MSVPSSLYVGSVTHRRLGAGAHHFRYRAFWTLLDLDELPRLSRSLRLFSFDRSNVFSLMTRDHGDRTATPLRSQIERRLANSGFNIGSGRIALLCMPRVLGFCFNPLSIYFCWNDDGALAALVYEVHNTLGERHMYVFPAEVCGGVIRHGCPKTFYVSPFLDMNLSYEFRVTEPVEKVALGIRVIAPTGPVMNAALMGARRDLNDRALLRVCATIPAVTLKVIAAIHWQALLLWLKGHRFRRRSAASRRGIAPSSDAGTRG